MQEVFIEVHHGLSRLEDVTRIKGWLATITTRVASRQLRKRRMWRLIALDGEGHYAQLEAPGASAEQRAQLMQLFERLDGLPVRERVAWSLRYLEGLSLEEVARACETSLATVKRRIASAAQALKEVTDE